MPMCQQNSYHLEVGNADIERFVHVCMPHNPHICHEECAKVSLKKNLIGFSFVTLLTYPAIYGS